MNEKIAKVKASKFTFVEDAKGHELLLKSFDMILEEGK